MKRTLFAILALALLAGCAQKQEIAAESTDGGKIKIEASNDPQQPTGTEEPQSDEPTAPGPDTPVSNDATPSEPPKEGDKPVVGTGVTARSLEGDYDGKIEIPKETMDAIMKMVPPEQQDMAKQSFNELKDIKVLLDMKSDGTYATKITARGKTEETKGTWTFDEAKKQITMKPGDPTPEQIAEAKKLGMTDDQIKAAKSKTQTVEVSSDGRVLTLNNTDFGMKVVITYTKR